MVDLVVNYVLSPFEWNIKPVNPQAIIIYLKATKEIDKEADKIYISVSNSKDIIDHFIIIANKYGWGRLAFMVETDAGAKNIFRHIEQIQISDMNHQSLRYVILLGIGNVVNKILTNPLVVLALQKLSSSRLVPAQDVHFFYTRSHFSALQNCAVLFSTNF